MTTNESLHDLRKAAVPRGVSNVTGVYAARALNAEIWDVEGRRYIDFAAGIAVVNTGHNNPRVKAAVAAQLDDFSHVCFQVTPYETYVRLADRLNRLVPGPTPKKTIFFTTGAEAVENAVKVARHYTKRAGVIAFSGGFHGRTMLASALTGKVQPYKAGIGPLPGEVYHLPFPIAYHGVTEGESLHALEVLFKAAVEPERIAAVIVEPVQGEGGFYPVPPSFFRALREITAKHGILLIADEIQTGFARTGKMFAIEHSDIEPDLMTTAKALAGGYPLSALTGKADIMDSPPPGLLGGTYAGSPLGCAAAHAVLDIMEEEDLCAKARAIGDLMVSRLTAMQRSNALAPVIGEVRGLGAMVALELVKGGQADEPNPDLTKALVQRAAAKGLILLPCGVRNNVIRLLSPLTAAPELVTEGLDILEASLREVVAEAA